MRETENVFGLAVLTDSGWRYFRGWSLADLLEQVEARDLRVYEWLAFIPASRDDHSPVPQ
jgi:hypothetical protein